MSHEKMSRRTALKLMGAAVGFAALGGVSALAGCKKYSQKRIVLYFTGTGNCLYVAKTLSEVNVSIPQAMKKGEFDYEAEEIGIVYPIYGQMPPNMVREFLKKAHLKCDYLFAVATYGNIKGGSVEVFERIAKDIGLRFDYIATLLMVDNWLPRFDMAEQIKMDKKIDENLSGIQADLAAHKKSIEAVTPEEHQKAEELYKRDSGPFRADGIHAKAEEWFTVTDKCITCGICMKVCPRANYKIETEIAVPKGDCELCLACVHACPHKAIVIASGEKNPNERFRNPNIKLSEIQRANIQIN